MTTSVAYWVLMLVWLILGIWSSWPIGGNIRPLGGSLLLFLLLILIGYKLFGPPIHG